MNDAMRAQTVQVPAPDGTQIEAYYAVPERGEPHGSVVVIHHAPGYDEATKEIARRFAAEGFAALCPNLYSREAPGLAPCEAAAQPALTASASVVGALRFCVRVIDPPRPDQDRR